MQTAFYLAHETLIKQSLKKFLNNFIKPELNISQISICLETPKNPEHGDIAITLAMALSKLLKQNPKQIAQAMVEHLETDETLISIITKIDIAGAGFVNISLSMQTKALIVLNCLQNNFFEPKQSNNQSIILEFVSANPTGPLHIGHGRQAVLGDCLANLLSQQGYKVHKEFYYNDAGVQIQTLAHSVQARAKGLKPGDVNWPENAYNGDYIADIAQAFINQQSVSCDDIAPIQANGNVDDFEAILQFAVIYLRNEQDIDLKTFGVAFNQYFLESSLYTTEQVKRVVTHLIEQGKTYEASNESGTALYLKTTDYGDDKDRVMRKSDGTFTYFVPDVAYHLNKFKRGFAKAINIQGSDHHGTIARVKAGLQAMNEGVDANFVQYILHKMVTVMKNGQEVKISKRAGSYITLRDLIEWSGESNLEENKNQIDLTKGRDVVRFFLISRKADTEFIFDVDLALKQNDENPVYYIQYAHARICSVLQQTAQTQTINLEDLSALWQTHQLYQYYNHTSEMQLIQRLAQYLNCLQDSANNYTPHLLAFYLKDLATDFHRFYTHCKVIQSDINVMYARLALMQASKKVLAHGLQLLGISAPSKM